MILFWRYFLPGSICQVIRMWPEVVCTRVGHVGVSQVASPWLCGWREADVGLQRLLSPRLDTNMKAALLLCLFVYRLKQHPTYFQRANHFVATPFLSHHRYMKTAVRIETSIKRRFIWWLSTWLLFAVHTTQEPNQNIWWPHDKKWRIAHGQDCAGPQHVRRNIPIPRTNVDKLYISPGSFLSCVLWYHCACDLTRFRHRNHLVKISGEKITFLSWNTCFYLLQHIWLEVFWGLVENTLFVTENMAGNFPEVSSGVVSKSLKAVVPHQTYPVVSHLVQLFISICTTSCLCLFSHPSFSCSPVLLLSLLFPPHLI